MSRVSGSVVSGSLYVTDHDTSTIGSGLTSGYLTWFGTIGSTASLSTVLSRPAMAKGRLRYVRVKFNAGADKEIGIALSVNGDLLGTTLGTCNTSDWTLFQIPPTARYEPGDTLGLYYSGMEINSRAIIRAMWHDAL